MEKMPEKEKKAIWGEQIRILREAIYGSEEELEKQIEAIFFGNPGKGRSGRLQNAPAFVKQSARGTVRERKLQRDQSERTALYDP